MSERTGYTTYATEPARNQAQEEREADDQDTKRFTDTPEVLGGETWQHASGHSGTRRAWTVSLAMVASFLLAGGGMTFGPRALLWIGIGLFAALGVYSLAAHTWTDYARAPQRSPEATEDR
jgi:hypothetical protein